MSGSNGWRGGMAAAPPAGKGYRVVILALVIVAALFISALIGDAEATSARRKAVCVGRQQLYDGQFVTIRFLAREFHATQKQTDAGLQDLRETLGPRPVC